MLKKLRARVGDWLGNAALKRIVKNTALLFGAETVVTLIGVIQFPLVTRWLGPTQYGVWGIVISWVGLVSQIFAFRLWETVIKYVSQFKEHEPARALAVLKLCLALDGVTSVFILVVMMLSAEPAARWVLPSRPDGALLIRLEALHLLMGATLSVWTATLRVFDRFRIISAYNVMVSLGLLGGYLTVLLIRPEIGALILVGALVKLLQTLGLARAAQRALREHFGAHWLAADLRVLIPYRREIGVMLFSMNVDALRKIAMLNADLVVLGWLTTPAQAGIYRLAKQLAGYLGRLTNPIYDTLYPEVARVYMAEGPAAVWILIKRVMRGVLFGLGGGLLGAYLFAPLAVPLIFGPAYLPALPLFYVISLTHLWAVGLWIPSVMLTTGRAKQLTVINTLSSLVMLTALLILAYWFGATGAAVALLTFHAIWLALGYPAARRALGRPAARLSLAKE